jgi:hypothetical protein
MRAGEEEAHAALVEAVLEGMPSLASPPRSQTPAASGTQASSRRAAAHDDADALAVHMGRCEGEAAGAGPVDPTAASLTAEKLTSILSFLDNVEQQVGAAAGRGFVAAPRAC